MGEAGDKAHVGHHKTQDCSHSFNPSHTYKCRESKRNRERGRESQRKKAEEKTRETMSGRTDMRMAMSAERAYCSWLVASTRVLPLIAPMMALLNTARPTCTSFCSGHLVVQFLWEGDFFLSVFVSSLLFVLGGLTLAEHSQVLSDGVWAARQKLHAWRLMQGCCVQNTAMADSGTELAPCWPSWTPTCARALESSTGTLSRCDWRQRPDPVRRHGSARVSNLRC